MDQAEQRAREILENVTHWDGLDKLIAAALREQATELSDLHKSMEASQAALSRAVEVLMAIADNRFADDPVDVKQLYKLAREALSSPDLAWWVERERLRDVVTRGGKSLSNLIRYDEKSRSYTIEGHIDLVGALLGDLRRMIAALQAHEAARRNHPDREASPSGGTDSAEIFPPGNKKVGG